MTPEALLLQPKVTEVRAAPEGPAGAAPSVGVLAARFPSKMVGAVGLLYPPAGWGWPLWTQLPTGVAHCS